MTSNDTETIKRISLLYGFDFKKSSSGSLMITNSINPTFPVFMWCEEEGFDEFFKQLYDFFKYEFP